MEHDSDDLRKLLTDPALRAQVSDGLRHALDEAVGAGKQKLPTLYKMMASLVEQLELAEQLKISAELIRPLLAKKIAALEALPDDAPSYGPIAVDGAGTSTLPVFNADTLNMSDLLKPKD